MGLIKAPTEQNVWHHNSMLQPTPVLLDDIIRVYAGFRDENGVSRVGSIDLDANNPMKIVDVCKKPLLDIGKDGMFDENGVTPTSVLKKGDDIYLYYAGYSQGKKVRFTVFTGLAVSKKGGSFERYQQIPITERVKTEELFRVIHSILFDGEKYRVWYGGGNTFIQGEHKTLPIYDVRYMESIDGLHFPDQGVIAVPVPEGCHRTGRPYVFFEDGIFKMYYGFGQEAIPYQLAYAESLNGSVWEIKDINLPLAQSGWDSQMMAYPAFIRNKQGRGFLFYNGNNYGWDGFGCAELIEE